MGGRQVKGAVWVSDPFGWGVQGVFADTVHSDEPQTHSQLLGPDGVPLKYEPQPRLGFDLSPKNKRGA